MCGQAYTALFHVHVSPIPRDNLRTPRRGLPLVLTLDETEAQGNQRPESGRAGFQLGLFPIGFAASHGKEKNNSIKGESVETEMKMMDIL